MIDENGKKVDGRKFNGGNKGCGRKPKAVELKLVEKLSPLEDEALEILFEKVREGDKDMLKLYMSYLYGNPKVKTENDTTMTVSTVELKDLISFDNDDNYISNETCFVKWTLKSYKITSGYGVLSETRISNTKVATLGYGYHEDGINPIPPSNVLVDSTVNYSVGYTLYDTYINNSVVNVSSDVIKRIPSSSSSKLLRTDEHRFFEIVFLNKYGVFDSFIFNRASKRIINITSDKYQFLQNTPNSYNPNIATNRIQNSNGVEQWTLNTDLLDETQNERLQQLMLSDRWWLLDHSRVLVIPVNLTDKTFTEKLGLYDRVKIQWTLKFESANNKINDIR